MAKLNSKINPALQGIMVFSKIATGVFTLFGILVFKSLYILPLSILLYLSYYLFYSKLAKTYILKIWKTGEGKITIIYIEKDVVKEFVSDANTLNVEKKHLWDRMKWKHIPYLKLHHNDFQLKQYEIEEWKEDRMDYIFKNIADAS